MRKLWEAARLFYHWKVRKSVVVPYQPVEVSIELTNCCNFKCSFCPQSDPTHFDRVPRTSLTPQGAQILMQRLRAAGLKTRIIHWTLDGEPFLNKHFHDVVAVAVRYGFNTHHFASNGYLMTLERLYQFPAQGQRYVVTPDFCCDEAYFETYRGTPGSWRRVLENICAALKDPGLSHFQFKVTDISSYTIRDREELDRRYAALKELFPQSDRISFHRRTFHNATGFGGASCERSKGRYHLCPYPWSSFQIASNGDVVACCRDLEHKTVLGNLFREDFGEIWNGQRYQALRRDLAREQPGCQAACAGCDMPYDGSKFSLTNLAKTAIHRTLLFR
jgi:radical SAM protein with 4Fe4S-binding SPASM domain